MNNYIANTNPNLKVVRRANDGKITLVPVAYWAELRYRRVPVDLTRMGTELINIVEIGFAIHDASDGRVYLCNGTIFNTLESFEEASR
jgi:hypothetical protein